MSWLFQNRISCGFPSVVSTGFNNKSPFPHRTLFESIGIFYEERRATIFIYAATYFFLLNKIVSHTLSNQNSSESYCVSRCLICIFIVLDGWRYIEMCVAIASVISAI